MKTAMMIEATNDSYRIPEKGIVGEHAVFDPAVLDVPAIDDAIRAQQSETEWNMALAKFRAAAPENQPDAETG